MSPNPPVHIQLGLFGGYAEIAGMHLVAAHTRVRSDGSEVFVGEHLRWNRGRSDPLPPGPRRAPPRPVDHPSLFETRVPPTPSRVIRMPELEIFPGAVQLPLWGS